MGWVRALGLALLLCVAPASAHELGDFGRVKPGVLNDKLIPETDRLMRRLGNQPVSDFNLTDEEKFLLLESNVGEGLFFAGLKHVAIKIVASYTEDQIITSDPSQLLSIRREKERHEGGA